MKLHNNSTTTIVPCWPGPLVMLVITNISFFLPLPLPLPPHPVSIPFQPPFSLYPRSPSLALLPTYTDLGRHSSADRRGGSRGTKPATQHVGPPSGPPRKGRAGTAWGRGKYFPQTQPKPETRNPNFKHVGQRLREKESLRKPPRFPPSLPAASLSLSSCSFPLSL